MKCLILAAGYATRLYPLTENFPKPLLQVGEKTILDWLVDDIAATGRVDGIAVISNHKFAAHFAQWAKSKPLEVNVASDCGIIEIPSPDETETYIETRSSNVFSTFGEM